MIASGCRPQLIRTNNHGWTARLFRHKYLDPATSLGELLFGLIVPRATN
jgi:hypothetical protein